MQVTAFQIEAAPIRRPPPATGSDPPDIHEKPADYLSFEYVAAGAAGTRPCSWTKSRS
jgi:hypothetical protein